VSNEERPPKPDTGCGPCDYVWMNDRGWVPSWNTNCDVHPSPSDLL
jgi:hypothetical protein